MSDLTAPLREAIAEAEQLIASAPFVETEQDLLEGYAYLAGRIRASVQLAFDHDLDRPVFINSTHQFSRQGLDNPDAVYFHAYVRDDAEYVVRGRRGTTADLSFQVMDGGYGPAAAPDSVAAFDDRFSDDDADHAYGGVHVLVLSGDRLIGHASAVPRRIKFGDEPWRTVGYVEAVATDPEHQGGGIGRRAMQALHAEISLRWPVALLSTGRATGFYELARR